MATSRSTTDFDDIEIVSSVSAPYVRDNRVIVGYGRPSFGGGDWNTVAVDIDDGVVVSDVGLGLPAAARFPLMVGLHNNFVPGLCMSTIGVIDLDDPGLRWSGATDLLRMHSAARATVGEAGVLSQRTWAIVAGSGRIPASAEA